MKKIGFIMQVLTLMAALPVLTFLEMSHGTERKALEYVLTPIENSTAAFTTSVITENIKKTNEIKTGVKEVKI